MELRIKHHLRNDYPLTALLVRGSSPKHWLIAIQQLGFLYSEVRIYPIPDVTPNSIWGCLVIPNRIEQLKEIGQYEYVQELTPNFFISEKSVLFPNLTVQEISLLFSEAIHVFHPVFGLVELTERFDVASYFVGSQQLFYEVIKPVLPVKIPNTIHRFYAKQVANTTPFEDLNQETEASKGKLTEEPLTWKEKLKLVTYRKLFKRTESDGNPAQIVPQEGLLAQVLGILGALFSGDQQWVSQKKQDYEDLEKRNQSELDKLMDLFKNNPEEALKYAIPLDTQGTTRGGMTDSGTIGFMQRWLDFSLSAGNAGGGGGTQVLADDTYIRLMQQYRKTAEELIKEKKYYKAAFIYFKLLKEPYNAADTLEKGQLYSEAAVMYLKHCLNKSKAAACYEQARMYEEAIALYKGLDENEKVGDLYSLLNKKQEAYRYYRRVLEHYKSDRQYLKASFLLAQKMQDSEGAQDLLLEGWRNNIDASNCLSRYLAVFQEDSQLEKELVSIYKNEVSNHNREIFLKVIHQQYQKHEGLQEPLRQMAYELVATHLTIKPSIVSELLAFNKSNQTLVKDTIRFKLNRR